MIQRSPQSPGRAKKMPVQKATEPAQQFAKLDANLVHQVQEILATWREVVETRNPQSHFLTDDRKTDWQRAMRPSNRMKPRTWWKHVDRVLQFFEEEWNSALQRNEEPLSLSRQLLLKGPPGGAMRPIA